MFLIAEDEGVVAAYHLFNRNKLPLQLTTRGAVSSIEQINNKTILISQSSLLHPTESYLLDIETGKQRSYTASSAKLEIDVQPEKFWFTGVDGRKVMAWVIKPPSSKGKLKSKSLPLAFLIHGGPQAAWEDAWSTRWNPAVFAEMGYFVVAVNPTGSTGYGQDFTDRIYQEWGGSKYHLPVFHFSFPIRF